MFFAYPVDAYTHHILCGESPHYGFVDQPVVAVCANRYRHGMFLETFFALPSCYRTREK